MSYMLNMFKLALLIESMTHFQLQVIVLLSGIKTQRRSDKEGDVSGRGYTLTDRVPIDH